MQIALMVLSLVLSGRPALAQAGAQAEEYSPQEQDAARFDPKNFTIDPASIRIVPLGAVGEPGTGDPGPQPPDAPSDPLVFLDRIINIFSKVWQIISDNKPVVDVNTTYAAAVPEGITHWSQLGGWSRPQGTRYGMYAKNLYGATVIDVRWLILRTHSGSYKGKGKYLSGVTVVPETVSAAWGYRFGLDASVPSVSNVGTSEDPVASMIAELKWKIATVVKVSQGTAVYYLEGNGAFREIGGPFQRDYHSDAEPALSRLRSQEPPATALR